MKYALALQQTITNKQNRTFPDARDPRARNGALFPAHAPKFPIEFGPGHTVFTIGSCFARNIEEALENRGVNLPTRSFGVPKSEWPNRPNGILNEFNPGAIAQRILYALAGKEFTDETIVPSGELFADLLLPGGGDVTLERARERREHIADVYRSLGNSDVVIITLGFVESWFDGQTGLFLNRPPPHAFGSKAGDRYSLRRLRVEDSMPLLDAAVCALGERGIRSVVTVSPVPLSTTFSADDCVVANEYSKSVLRVCAENLRRHPLVDYFPSYEIVRSCGLPAYEDDCVHVREDLVAQIVEYMVSSYQGLHC